MSRKCYMVDLGDGRFATVQTNGPPPTEADVAALRDAVEAMRRRGNPNQWPVDGDGREVEA